MIRFRRLFPLLLLALCIGGPAPAQGHTRIISLYAAHTENLFELGLDAEIIGVSQFEDHPAAALTRPAFSAKDGVERFLAARPDMVLIRPMLETGYPGLWQALRDHGVEVVSLQPNTMDEMFAYWRTLGELTDRRSEAEAMVAKFQAEVVRLRVRRDKVPPTDRPRVFFESIHRKLATFSPGSMPLWVLDMAGGVNAAPDAEPRHNTNIAPYGQERVLSLAERIDLYLAQTGVMNRVDRAAIEAEPGFSAIKAVREGRIGLVDERLVSRPTMRLLQGVEAIRALLPDNSEH